MSFLACDPEGAIAAAISELGADSVLVDKESMARYLWGDIPDDRTIAAVVLPKSVEEVQHIVNIAKRFNTPVYPISTGNNWGYGAARPATNGNIIVDLSKMNKIVEVNKELAYVVVEPGVTQAQLFAYLEDNNIPLFIDPSGAGPNCSILGNTIERGYGITPMGDHFAQQCGMEVVLANGEILKTGFGHYETSKVTHTFKWGVGPYLDGLFTQSSFGVVTKIGVWLMPKPEHFEACYFSVDKDEDVNGLIEAVRGLLLHDVFRSSVNLMHRNRVMTVLRQYPWDEMDGKVPMSEGVASKIAADLKLGVWNCVGALYGTKAQVTAAKKAVNRALSGKVAKLNYISEFRLGLLEKYQGLFSIITGMNIPEMVKVLRPSFGILSGIPNEVALATPYWRSKMVPPAKGRNCAKDNCGVIWLSPVIPMTTSDVAQFRMIIEPIFARHGFDCCITLTTVTSRSFDSTIPILYNRKDAEETKKADACYHELLEALISGGYIPYRFGIQSMNEIAGRRDVFWDTVETLKGVLDPQRILSPGRYSRS